MAWQARVLVVANRTAESDELRAALEERARAGAVAFTLLMPAGPSRRSEARARLDSAVERLCDCGLDASGMLGGDPNPVVAVSEAWDPAHYDEIIVSTLPTGVSRWLQIDLPRQVAKLTDAPVAHVVAKERRPTAV
jgi:hypothetical protein